MNRIEKEIEFYRDLFGKVYTMFLVVSGGTVAHFSQKGMDFLTVIGTIVSVCLFVSLLTVGYIYKEKINLLKE
jgi:hypothetical protein